MRHLRYVLAVAEAGSIRATGRLLQVEQSSISGRIRALEDEIGAAIFIRTNRGIVPTFAGEEFLREVREGMTWIERTRGRYRHGGRCQKRNRPPRPDFLYGVGFPAAPDRGIQSVELRYVEGGLSEQLHAVQQHRVDVAFVIGPVEVPDCAVLDLWRERVCVALPRPIRSCERTVLNGVICVSGSSL